MKCHAARCAILLGIYLVAAGASSQEPVAPRPVRDLGWVSLGVGAGTPAGLTLSLVASTGSNRLLQAGGRTIETLDLFEDNQLNALHIGAGLSRPTRVGRLALAAGPAVVWGHRNRFDSAESFVGPGVALDAQATLAVAGPVAVGLGAFGLISPHSGAAGLSVLIVLEGRR